MRRFPFVSILALIPLAVANTAGAVVLHVPGDAATIQAAVTLSHDGDEIVVDPGTYAEHVAINHRGPLYIHSSLGAASTIIDGTFAGSPVSLSVCTGMTIEGFTIRNGRGPGIISDYPAGPNTFTANTIENNSGTDDGGGVYAIRGSYTITHNIIRNNQANYSGTYDGGGIYTYLTSGEIAFNTFEGNTGHEGGGIIINASTSPSLLVHDNLFHNNHATAFGGGVYINFNTSPSVYQNTIVENRADINGGGVWFTDGSAGTAAHNIVALNTAPTGAGIMGYGSSGVLTMSCNDVWSNTGGNYGGSIADQTGLNGNISNDPLFCGPFAGLWTLADSSPAASAACGLMGAFGVGCAPTPVRPTTWGAIKATFQPRN